MKQVLIAGVPAVLLSACALLSNNPAPRVAYATLEESKPDAKTLEEALQASPALELKLALKSSADIGPPDRVLAVEGLESGYANEVADRHALKYFTYYKVFAMDVFAGGDYLLTVTSACHQGGIPIQRTALVPLVYVVDSEI